MDVGLDKLIAVPPTLLRWLWTIQEAVDHIVEFLGWEHLAPGSAIAPLRTLEGPYARWITARGALSLRLQGSSRERKVVPISEPGDTHIRKCAICRTGWICAFRLQLRSWGCLDNQLRSGGAARQEHKSNAEIRPR